MPLLHWKLAVLSSDNDDDEYDDPTVDIKADDSADHHDGEHKSLCPCR